ncbi:MAG: helix-turn-helix transcriptional regulator [Blastocatellales bacterium]
MDQRVCDVMRKLREQELPPPPGNLQAITRKIISQTKQKMSIEQMAREVELSESRLRALFKSDLGLTPNQYVRKIKMDTAADLLRKTYHRVAEIAAILGFNDNSRFICYFKETHGMTPAAYRKFHQRQNGREAARKIPRRCDP